VITSWARVRAWASLPCASSTRAIATAATWWPRICFMKSMSASPVKAGICSIIVFIEDL
jgi:hypothetical protein